MFWRKKQIPSGSVAGRLSQQMESDGRVSEAIEFFNKSLQTVVSCKEGFLRGGLKAEFESVQHEGALLLLASSSLNLVRSPSDIPKLLEKFASSVTSFINACDKLTEQPASSDDVKTMMDALTRAAGNVVVVVQEEYK
jgi:hypothetical protein